MASIHVPVLLKEVVEGLKLQEAKSKKQESALIYLDGTLGGAGHAMAVAEALEGKVIIVGLDRNKQAIEEGKGKLEGKAEKVILEVESFRNLDKVLEKHNIEKVDRILLDLGLSSDELDNSGRGFTFQKDEPLLMTMGDPDTYPFTAKTIVNDWDEEVIADVIFGYGEERFARRIARAIIVYRDKKTIETTHELAEIIKGSVPGFYRRGKIHPATRTFQALRIAVNEELNALKEGLTKGYEKLNAGGVMAIISFHSLEDRIVKEFFKSKAVTDDAVVSRKPLRASDEEILHNPRARSARLRVLERRN
ncbi:MAG: 16S rRNA (cytosine(1402)-N(4))-methyltransferase RsmH [Patescibacteria group bacterium]